MVPQLEIWDSTDCEAAKSTLQKEALENGVRSFMEESKLDAIIGLTDGLLSGIAAAIRKITIPVQFETVYVDTCRGGPVVAMLLGLLNLHGRPFGLSVITLSNRDAVLFKVLSAWEAIFLREHCPRCFSSRNKF